MGDGAHTAADIKERHIAVSLGEHGIKEEARGR
jgi:hypothetical protein